MEKGQGSIGYKVYMQLRDDITLGLFKPGEHLSEKLLTQKYGVSRTLTREVIRQLAAEGYLSFEPNRGAIVTKLTLQDVDVTYNILLRCEAYAAGLFAKCGNEIVIKKLVALHKKMKEKNVTLDYRIWLGKNDEFHKLIYTNCGNSALSDFIHHTRLRIYRFRIVRTKIKVMDSCNNEHRKMLSAIRDKNGKRVEKLMANHLDIARKRRLEIIRQFSSFL